ncbi:MAG: DUF1851 domain-containing protein [Bacteroidetes bacterium]|nr:DUF1851 domain-containing protein [Bacteroidota bacterium]
MLLLEEYGGTTFDNGLFRIHNEGSFYYWTKLTFEYFKKFKGSALVFGFDWVGRQFALSEDGNKSIILMFDPATAEAFELEASLEDFFNIDLAEGKEDLLEEKKFRSFKRSMAADLQFDHCVGFIKPLFLGGQDDIANLENTDMEVYWELNYQIYCQTKDLPPGTLINLSIEP